MESIGIKSFDKSLRAFEDEINKVYLSVENSDGETVYSTETSQKHNISFRFTLEYEGTYTFKVEAKRVDGSLVFKGVKTKEVKYDQENLVQIDAYFENGRLRANIIIENEIWERYSVEWSTLTVYKSPKEDFPEPIEERTLTFDASEVICYFDLYPGVYDVEFKIFLRAKDVNIEPYEWTNENSPTLISVQISPSKIKPIITTVLFDTEIKVVMNSSNIDVPYIRHVQNFNGTYNIGRNELVLI